MKKVRKPIPVDYLDLAGMEAWLEEMAAQGFHLERIGSFFALFQEGAPAKVRYRLEPELSKYEDQEAFDSMVAESGWESVTFEHEAHCWVYRNNDPNASEMHTDPYLQSKILGKVVKRESRGMVLGGVAFLVSLLFLLSLLVNSEKGLTLRLVEETSVYHLFFPFLALFGLLGVLRSALHLKELAAIRKQMEAGFPFPREPGKRKGNYPARLFRPLIILLFTVSSLLQFAAIGLSQSQPVAEAQLPFPMPAVSKLVGDAELDPEPHYIQDFLADVYNRAEYDWYPLANIWEADYYLTAANGEKEYRFTAKWYDLRLPFLAKGLTEDLAGAFPAVDASAQGLDHLLVSEQPGRSSLFACAGDKVLMLKWSAEEIEVDLIPIAQEILAGK